MPRAFSPRFLRISALLVLLGAVLPNVLYVGHWPIFGETHEHLSPEEAEEHAEHCHLAPAKCSGEATLTGTWSLGGDSVSITVDGTPVKLELANYIVRHDDPVTRIERPPRASWSQLSG